MSKDPQCLFLSTDYMDLLEARACFGPGAIALDPAQVDLAGLPPWYRAGTAPKGRIFCAHCADKITLGRRGQMVCQKVDGRIVALFFHPDCWQVRLLTQRN